MTEPAIQELIEGGASLDEISAALRSDVEREALDRLAIPRTFDAETYELLTRDLEGAPPLEALVADASVERLPRSEGLYRLARRERRSGATATEADAGDAFDQPLAELCARRGNDVEAIYHLLGVDPDQALARFERLFAEADARFELNRCQDLVDAVAERRERLDPMQSAALDEHERYLASRSQFVQEWYRTARFLGPKTNLDAFDRLLKGDEGRALALWARGGMGKTMHLRWLIARRCVPRPERVACARIDFDFVDPRVAAAAPWLLLLEMAAQLDPQLPRRPFVELLGQYGSQRARLERRTGAADESALGTAERLMPDAIGDLRERFLRPLVRLRSQTRVLLVLDTLEVALLPGGAARGQSDLDPLLEEFARVHDGAECVRVVLAGRYQLGARTSRLFELLPGVRELQLTEFGGSEIAEYLRMREVDRPDLADAVLKSSGGVPLKVSLVTDVVEQDRDISVDEVLSYKDVDLLYLVERVLRRIDPPLRWLVSFGALMRRLDVRLVSDVLYPYVCAALRGELPHDEYPDAGLEAEDLQIPDAGALWADLEHHAGQASWVDRHGGADVVQFHPEVARPVRGMRRGPTARRLHDDAAAFFEARASEDRRQAGRWAAEAIYHRFQNDGPAAAKHWQNWIERLADDARSRHVLAADLLGSDYLEDGRPLGWAGGSAIVGDETIAEARYQLALAAVERARAAVDRARAGERASMRYYFEARDAIKDVEHLQAGQAAPPVEPWRIALVLAHLRLLEGDGDGAAPHVATALAGRPAPRQRFTLALAAADGLAAQGDDAVTEYERAVAAAGQLSSESGKWRDETLARLADHHAERDRLAEAETTLGRLSPEARKDPSNRLRGAELWLRAGRPTHASAVAAELAEADPQSAAAGRASLLVNRAALLLGSEDQALNVPWGEGSGSGAGPADTESLHLLVEREELAAEALAARLAVGEACSRLEHAASLSASRSDSAGVRRAHVRAAEIAWRLGGDLRSARVSLEEARRARDATPMAAIDLTLMESELEVAQGGKPRPLPDDLRSVAQPPRGSVRIALAHLALGVEPDASLALLTQALERVTPPAARLALLAPLERCRPQLTVSHDLRDRLRALVPSPHRDHDAFRASTPAELIHARLLDAELERVLGAPLGALADELESLAAELRTGPPTVRWAALARLAVRCGERDVARRVASEFAEAARPEHAVLAAATVIDSMPVGIPADPLDPAGRDAVAEQLALLEREVDGHVWIGRGLERLAADQLSRGESPGELGRRAAACYSSLGDEVATQRAAALSEGVQLDVLPSHMVGRDFTKTPGIHVDDPLWDIKLHLRIEGGIVATHAATQSTRQLSDADLADAVQMLVSGAASEGVTWGVLARLLSPDFRPLSVLLAPDWESVRCALTAEPWLLHALPWELTVAAHSTLFRVPRLPPAWGEALQLQRALNAIRGAGLVEDDVAGPATAEALRKYQSSCGLPVTSSADAETARALLADLTGGPAPRVLVLRPVERQLRKAARGLTTTPEAAYRSAGYDPEVVEVADPSAFERAVAGIPAAIVHICCGLVDAHGTPALDLTPAAHESRENRVYPKELEHACSALPMRPLLVLDVPAPAYDEEAMVQLLLRNAFAADFAQLGSLGPVLATGLVADGIPLFYTGLVSALTTAGAIASVAGALRSASGRAAVGTALFARDPDWLVPLPR